MMSELIQESLQVLRGADSVAVRMFLGTDGDGVWKALHRALVFADKALTTLAQSDPERVERVLAARNCRYLGDNTLHSATCAVFEQDDAGRFLGNACTCGAITD